MGHGAWGMGYGAWGIKGEGGSWLSNSHTRQGLEAPFERRSSAGMDDIIARLLVLYYAGSIKLLNMSFRSAWQFAAVSACRPFGKSQSTELWILLASSHVLLSECVASTMRTCSLSTCAPGFALICSGVPHVGFGMPPSLQLEGKRVVIAPFVYKHEHLHMFVCNSTTTILELEADQHIPGAPQSRREQGLEHMW